MTKLTLHRLPHPELPPQLSLQLRQLSSTATLDRHSCNLHPSNFCKPWAPLHNLISLHSIMGIFVFHWCLILKFWNLWKCMKILHSGANENERYSTLILFYFFFMAAAAPLRREHGDRGKSGFWAGRRQGCPRRLRDVRRRRKAAKHGSG